MRDEDVDERYNKYSENLKRVFSELEIKKSDAKVNDIIDLAKRYLKDAEYFKNENKHITALISLAYSEGLLDALRFIDYVNFAWTDSGNENKK